MISVIFLVPYWPWQIYNCPYDLACVFNQMVALGSYKSKQDFLWRNQIFDKFFESPVCKKGLLYREATHHIK